MLEIDLRGKRAFVAGVADDGGYGFAIAKALAEAGASVIVGTWPPAMNIFEKLIKLGRMDESLTFADGSKMSFEAIIPLDAEYDRLEDAPEEIRNSKRYQARGDFSIDGAAKLIKERFGERSIDIVVHSLANGPEVKNPLLETSRHGYLGAVGASAYSFVSLVQRFGPLLKDNGSFLALSYLAAERTVPGYGGGMSTAKAALESDVRTLAFEAGRRWGARVNAISAGPYASRAASAIGFIGKMIDYYAMNSPIPERIKGEEVGHTAAFLSSALASGITGSLIHVDKGYHSMAVPADVDGILDALSSEERE